MANIYLSLKFVHVAAASLWVGGLLALSILNARLARAADPQVIDLSARQSQWIGQRVLGPSAAVTLLAGGAAMGLTGIGFSAWVIWGLVVVALSIALGATVMRRTVSRLIERSATAERGDAGVAALQRRVALVDALLVVLLLSAVWAMVFKPVL
jgi:putative copper export protein